MAGFSKEGGSQYFFPPYSTMEKSVIAGARIKNILVVNLLIMGGDTSDKTENTLHFTHSR